MRVSMGVSPGLLPSLPLFMGIKLIRVPDFDGEKWIDCYKETFWFSNILLKIIKMSSGVTDDIQVYWNTSN